MNNTTWGQVLAQEGKGFKVRLYYDNTLFMLEWNKLQKSIPILESVVTSAEKGIEERVEEILDMQAVLNSIIKTRVSAKRSSDITAVRKAFDRALADRNYQQSQADEKQSLVDQKTTEREQIQNQWDQEDALAKQYATQNPDDEDNPYEPNRFDDTLKAKEQELKDAEKNLELAQSDLRIYQRIFDEKKLAYDNILTLGNEEKFAESVRRVSTEIAFYEEDLNAIRRSYARQKAQLLTAQQRKDYLYANYPYTLIYEIQSVNGSVSVGEWVHVLTVQGFTEEVVNKIKELYTTIAAQQQIVLEKFFEIDKLYEQIVPLQNKVDKLWGEKWQLQEARAFFRRWGDQEKASQYDDRISNLGDKIGDLEGEIKDLRDEEEDKRDLIEESNKVIATSILQIEKEKSSDHRYFIAKVAGARPIGELRRSVASTAAQTFFNFAILPGWQKYYPTYRLGTITFMYKKFEEDDSYRYLCDVTLDDRFSECQGLPINLKDELKEVSFESYLTDEFFYVYIGIDDTLPSHCQAWNKNFTGSYSGKKCLINFPERNWEEAIVVWVEGKNVGVEEGFYLRPMPLFWDDQKDRLNREYQLYYRKDGVDEMRRQFNSPAEVSTTPLEGIIPGWANKVPICDIHIFTPMLNDAYPFYPEPIIYSKITDNLPFEGDVNYHFFDENGTLFNINQPLDKDGNLIVCDFRVERGGGGLTRSLLDTPPYRIWYISQKKIEPYSRCDGSSYGGPAIREFCNTTSSTTSPTPAEIQSSLSKDTSPTPSGIRCYARAEQDGLAYCWPLVCNTALPEEEDKTNTKSSITVKREKKKVIAELFVIRANLSEFSIGRSWGTGLGKLEGDSLTQTALSICKKLPEKKKKLTWLPSVVDFGFAAPCRDSNAPAAYATANASTLPATTGFLGLFCKGTTPPPPKVTLEIILSGVLESTGEVYYVTLKHERTNDSPFPPIPPHLTIVSVNYEVTPDTSRYFKKGVGRGIMVSEDSTTDYKILSTATGKVMSENNTHGTLKSIGACVSVVSLPCFSIKSICLNAIASSEVCFKTRTICLMHEQPDDNEDVTYEVKFELVINEDGEPELKPVVTEKRTRLCSSNISKSLYIYSPCITSPQGKSMNELATPTTLVVVASEKSITKVVSANEVFAISSNATAATGSLTTTTLTILANSRNARSGPPALPKILSVMVQPVPMSISSSGMSSASIEPMLISSIGMSTYSPIQLDMVQTFYGHSYTATPQPFNWGILFKMGGNPLFPFNWELLTFILKVKNPRYIYSHVDLPRPGLYPGLGRWSGVARTAGIKSVCRVILKLSEGNRLGFKFGFAEMFAEKRKTKKLSLVSDSLVLTTCSKKREVGFVTTSSITAASVFKPEKVLFYMLSSMLSESVYHVLRLPVVIYMPAIAIHRKTKPLNFVFSEAHSKFPNNETPCLKTFTNVLTRSDLYLPLKCHATSSLGQELAKLNAGAAVVTGWENNYMIDILHAGTPSEKFRAISLYLPCASRQEQATKIKSIVITTQAKSLKLSLVHWIRSSLPEGKPMNELAKPVAFGTTVRNRPDVIYGNCFVLKSRAVSSPELEGVTKIVASVITKPKELETKIISAVAVYERDLLVTPKFTLKYAAASSSQEMNKPVAFVAVETKPITSPQFIITCATNNEFSWKVFTQGKTESVNLFTNLLFHGNTAAKPIETKLSFLGTTDTKEVGMKIASYAVIEAEKETSQARALAYLLQQTDEEIQATNFNLFLKAVHLKSDGLYETPPVTVYNAAIAHDEAKGLAPTAKGTYAHAWSFLEKKLSPQTKIPLNTQTATLSSIPSGEFGDAISILWKQETELPLLGRALLYNSSFLAKKVYPIQAIFNLGLVGLEARNYAYATLNLPVNFTLYAYTSSCKECTKNCLEKCIDEEGRELGRPIDFIDTVDLITNLTVYSIPIP